MSAKHTWTDQEPQLGHFGLIILDLCLQSSWAGVGSCPSSSGDKLSRCTTVSTCRSLSSEIRQATNIFPPALTCERGFLHIRKLWFLDFIFLICALTYFSVTFRYDCNCNMLASLKVVKEEMSLPWEFPDKAPVLHLDASGHVLTPLWNVRLVLPCVCLSF